MKPYRHEPIKTRTTAPKELRIDLRPAEELKPNPANARFPLSLPEIRFKMEFRFVCVFRTSPKITDAKLAQ